MLLRLFVTVLIESLSGVPLVKEITLRGSQIGGYLK